MTKNGIYYVEKKVKCMHLNVYKIYCLFCKQLTIEKLIKKYTSRKYGTEH